jgi:hypothetical protein
MSQNDFQDEFLLKSLKEKKKKIKEKKRKKK